MEPNNNNMHNECIKVIAWNIRGNIHNKIKRIDEDLLQKENPDILFLFETALTLDDNQIRNIKSQLIKYDMYINSVTRKRHNPNAGFGTIVRAIRYSIRYPG